MTRLNRPRRRSSESGSDAWLLTYSDMVTLLLAFFVLLYSFSTVDMDRFTLALVSLQKALGILDGGQAQSDAAEPLLDAEGLEEDLHAEASQMEQLMQVRERLARVLHEGGMQDGISFDLQQRGLIIHFTDQVLFESGSADLKSEAVEILDEVAPILGEVPNHIRIEGHTDNVPISTAQFPSNWELSTSRATNVLQYFVNRDVVDPERLTAAGYGEHRPVATNETAEGRAQNRRVDIVLLRLDAEQYEPSDILEQMSDEDSEGVD